MLSGRTRSGLILLAALFALNGCSTPAPRPVISLTPDRIDLGKVAEGVEVKTAFTIKNEGNAELVIHEAKSSCGCTTSTLEKNILAPGQATGLTVLIDTSMKQGTVTKTLDVSSNDPESPVVKVPITLHVPDEHKGLTDRDKAKILTDEKCMSCHVYRGVGLGGKELYEADCAMCHGKDATGAVGGALIYGDYDNRQYAKHIRDVISYGSKTHISMPGFLDKAGGPLVKEQVDSLIDYLAKLSKERKSKATGSKPEENGGVDR